LAGALAASSLAAGAPATGALAAAGLAAGALAVFAGWADAPAHARRPASASSTRSGARNAGI